MKLTPENLPHKLPHKGYRLPSYDIHAVRARTFSAPAWLHFGAGNLFRAFPAVLAQRMLTAGLTETGIVCCEGHAPELIDRVYRENDHLFVVATLYPDGFIQKEVVASVTESLHMQEDHDRLTAVFTAPSLQMVSLTITERAYRYRDMQGRLLPDFALDAQAGPELADASFFGRLTALCIKRYRAGSPPLALVSLDNFGSNGRRLRRAVMDMAALWLENGLICAGEFAAVTEQNTYPLTMIDKITPHPDRRTAAQLEADGLSGMRPFVTQKGTHTAAFVGTERPQYLLIEDNFPGGHPPLEQLGIILTSRAIVDRAAHMNICTCLGPTSTALGIFGCLLGYDALYQQMQDVQIVRLITRLSMEESMPMAEDPGIISPEQFVHELLGERYTNPFLPDTPQRLVTDTSQKLSHRFGQTLLAYYHSPLPVHRVSSLTYIPLALAGWLRYLLGVDDTGYAFTRSPDPLLAYLDGLLAHVHLRCAPVTEKQLYPLLSSRILFGISLYEVGAADRVTAMFNEMLQGPGAVRRTLIKYCGK